MKYFDVRILVLVVITWMVMASIHFLAEYNDKPRPVEDFAMAEPFSLVVHHVYLKKQD